MQNVITASIVSNGISAAPLLTGKAERIKGAALMPFDTIDAVYAENERSNNGKPVFSVRVKSGDVVKVVQRNEKWEAVL